EPGIPGVQITLTGTDDLGNSVNLPPQFTDGNGAYVFLNLRPGSYYITETPPAGYLQGIDSIGTAGGSLTYATVRKERKGGRVVGVTSQVVLGSEAQAEEALEGSERSQAINTSFVERWFGTQRQLSGRKKRKAYTFSKGLSFHEACTWLVVVWYN